MRKQASSILVLLRYGEEDTDVKPVIGDGMILWSGQNGFEWIGKMDEDWDSVFLIKYNDILEYQRAIERFRDKDFKQIRLFAVRPMSIIKLRFIRFLMKYIFSRFSVDLSQKDFNLDDVPQSDILPTREQHTRLASEDKGQPVFMLNLLKYHDQPLYPLEYEGKRSKNGEDAYNRYGQHAMRAVAKLGGVLENLGEINALLIGDPDEKWAQFAFMRYPSRSSLQSMFRMKQTPDAAIQRDAGLKATKTYAFTPV
ncbi:MAG: hypothetical protein ACTSQZ_00780 [Candidatus Thorarchaeota archaeon]